MANFITKYRRLELVIKPSFYETIAGRRILHEGKRIIFEDNNFETTDKEEIKFLLNHNGFNKKFYLKGLLIQCEYCGRNFQLKASKVTHENHCKQNPDRIIGKPEHLKKFKRQKKDNKRKDK